ncbi:MAG TPA: glycosyltransferase family 39 protein [Polyangiaceae bacterium]|nr:glycosyltransferase family 39 protein [Polyangiaceae bacterium]
MSERRTIGWFVRREYVYTLVVALVALLPRLYVAIAWSREPVWDGHYYHLGAERLAQGLGYSEDGLVAGHVVWRPWIHYPVGYSFILSLFYRLLGPGLLIAPIFNAVLGAGVAALVHRLGRHFTTSGRAKLAAALVALNPGLIAYSPLVMTEVLATALLLGAGLALLAWPGSWRGYLTSGAILGVAALVRPDSLLALPLLALMSQKPYGKSLLRALAAMAMAFVVVLPWTYRNCQKLDGCALVSTNGGWNLAIGALTPTGRFTTLKASDGCAVVSGQVQQDDCWRKVGEAKILENPGRWLALVPKKLEQTYNHESYAVEYLHEADPAVWTEPRRVAGRELLTFFHRLLLVVAALGAVSALHWVKPPPWDDAVQIGLGVVIMMFATFAAAREDHAFYWLPALLPVVALLPLPGRPELGPAGRYLMGLLAATTFTHCLLFGEDRYHLVETPVLCLFAAGALRPRKVRLRLSQAP